MNALRWLFLFIAAFRHERRVQRAMPHVLREAHAILREAAPADD